MIRAEDKPCRVKSEEALLRDLPDCVRVCVHACAFSTNQIKSFRPHFLVVVSLQLLCVSVVKCVMFTVAKFFIYLTAETREYIYI